MLSISTTAHSYFFQFTLSWLSLQHFFDPPRTYLSCPISWPPVLTFRFSQIIFYSRKLSLFPNIHLPLPLPPPPISFLINFQPWRNLIWRQFCYSAAGHWRQVRNTHTPSCSTSVTLLNFSSLLCWLSLTLTPTRTEAPSRQRFFPSLFTAIFLKPRTMLDPEGEFNK